MYTQKTFQLIRKQKIAEKNRKIIDYECHIFKGYQIPRKCSLNCGRFSICMKYDNLEKRINEFIKNK